MGSAARTVNLPLHGGKTYTPLCRHAQHFFSHSAAFTKYISKCRLFPYGLRNRARFLSRQRTAIPPWHLTVGRLFCWESPYCLRHYGLWSPCFAFAQYGLWSPCFAFAQYGLLVALFRFRSIRALGRPISLSLNTGSWSPYFAFAQYGLWSPYFAFAQYGLHLRLCARAGAIARIRLRPPPQTPPPRGGAQIPCRFRASRSNPQQRRALSKGSTLQSLHYYMVIS